MYHHVALIRSFPTQDDAARYAIRKYFYIANTPPKVEYCGFICKDDFTREYFITVTTDSKVDECNIYQDRADKGACPKCSSPVSYWHTHPFGEKFSPDDKGAAGLLKGKRGYLGTPSKRIKRYDFPPDGHSKDGSGKAKYLGVEGYNVGFVP